MNWQNVNLKDAYQLDQNIIDPLSFKDLLILINCNIKDTDINKETILKEFEASLKCKIRSAREVMRDNIENILAEAKGEEEAPEPTREEWSAILKVMSENENEPQEIKAVYTDYFIDYFTNILPPITWSSKHVLCSEPHHHTNEGAGVYAGFFKKGEKFYGVYTTKNNFKNLTR